MSKLFRPDQERFQRQLASYLYLAELYKEALQEKPDIRQEFISCVDSTTLCIAELGDFEEFENKSEYDAEIDKVQLHLARLGNLIAQLMDSGT